MKKHVGGRIRRVKYNDECEVSTSCSCKKFESEGILCRHVIRVFFPKGCGKYFKQAYIVTEEKRCSTHPLLILIIEMI